VELACPSSSRSTVSGRHSTSGHLRLDPLVVLQELQLADSVQDLRHRGGTCKLVGDRDHLRPFVEGPLSGYGFRWKEAKGRRHGCYWTDHGKLSLPKQGRPAGRGDQGT
jgi:hypothetical protein